MQKFLLAFKGSFILISHDSSFMDKVVTHIIGIHRQKVVKIAGGYEKYKRQIISEEKIFEHERVNKEKQKKKMEQFINKFRAKARQSSLAQSRQKMLDKLEIADKLSEVSKIEFSFQEKEFPSKGMMTFENLSFRYDSQDEDLFKNLSFHINYGDKIGVIGKNGKGKSTLLNLISSMDSVQQHKIYKHPKVEIGHFQQTNIDTLYPENNIEEEVTSANPYLDRTKILSICGTMLFTKDDTKKKIKVLSGGEKSRVLMAKILAKPINLLLLDEPTNHLDQESVDSLLQAINKFKGASLIVTHNEMILEKYANKLLIFQKENCDLFLGSYQNFLEKIGWEDAKELKKTVNKPAPIHKKQLAKIRKEITKEYLVKINELKKKIVQIEDDLQQCYNNITEINETIIEKSTSKKGSEIKELSIKLKEEEEKSRDIFTSFEQHSEELRKN